MKLKNIILSGLAATVLAGGAPLASAFSLGLQPTAASYQAGATLRLNLVVNGLQSDGHVLSAYDLDIGGPAALFTGSSAIQFFAPLDDSGSGAQSILSGTFAPGSVNLFGMSLLNDAALEPLQDDSFVLGSLDFFNVAAGDYDFSLNVNALAGRFIQDFAENLLDSEPGITGAHVSVRERGTQVPEPASGVLLAGALLVLAARRLLAR